MVDFDKLLVEIREGARLAFTACRTARPSARFVGYALYSDDGAMTICHAAATEEAMLRWSNGEPEEFRFNPGEWDLQEGLEHLDRGQARIEAPRTRGDSDEAFVEFRLRFFEVAVKALEELIAEGFFRTVQDDEDTFVTFSIMDTEHTAWLRDWAQRLNAPNVFDQYQAWHSRWAK